MTNHLRSVPIPIKPCRYKGRKSHDSPHVSAAHAHLISLFVARSRTGAIVAHAGVRLGGSRRGMKVPAQGLRRSARRSRTVSAPPSRTVGLSALRWRSATRTAVWLLNAASGPTPPSTPSTARDELTFRLHNGDGNACSRPVLWRDAKRQRDRPRRRRRRVPPRNRCQTPLWTARVPRNDSVCQGRSKMHPSAPVENAPPLWRRLKTGPSCGSRRRCCGAEAVGRGAAAPARAAASGG